MNKKRFVRRWNKRKSSFNPDSDYINSAIEDFLKNGGKIARVEVCESALVDLEPDRVSADDFLMGR